MSIVKPIVFIVFAILVAAAGGVTLVARGDRGGNVVLVIAGTATIYAAGFAGFISIFLTCAHISFSENVSAPLRVGASAPCYRSTEDIWVVPVVVAPLELRHVERKVFAADVVERAHDAALQQGPEAVNGLSVDVAAHVFTAPVRDELMRTLAVDAATWASWRAMHGHWTAWRFDKTRSEEHVDLTPVNAAEGEE